MSLVWKLWHLKTKYPQGGERQLIYATTGRAINSTMLPADAGCVVDNVETMINIYQAVVEGKPSIERIVTVSGDAINEPGNFRAPFGMNQMELVEQAGGFKEEPEKVISGGPMMGFAMFTVDVPVTKTSSSVLAFVKDPVKRLKRPHVSTVDVVWMPVQAVLFRLVWLIMHSIMMRRHLKK